MLFQLLSAFTLLVLGFVAGWCACKDHVEPLIQGITKYILEENLKLRKEIGKLKTQEEK